MAFTDVLTMGIVGVCLVAKLSLSNRHMLHELKAAEVMGKSLIAFVCKLHGGTFPSKRQRRSHKRANTYTKACMYVCMYSISQVSVTCYGPLTSHISDMVALHILFTANLFRNL